MMIAEISSLHLPWVFAVMLTLFAGMGDLRNRKIPNRLTVPALLFGVFLNTLLGGWKGFLVGVEGAGLGLAILLPVVLMRGLGAGDWKLMGALGALVGPDQIITILLVAVCMAAGWGVVEMFRQHRVKSTLRNLWELVHGFVVFGLRPNPNISIDAASAPLIKLPFGAVAAVATAVTLSVAWIGR